MILIKPSFEILHINVDSLYLIEHAGRTCYKSVSDYTLETGIKFVTMLLNRGHESVIEHASATVKIICDRGVSHEIVRHRIASYSQESTRYCDYTGGHVTFVIPPWCDIEPGVYNDSGEALHINDAMWWSAMWDTEQRYKALRTMGWRPEQARSVLPNSLKTEIVMTANLREWRHFFKLRCAPAAHPQMREIAIPLAAEFQRVIPVLFDEYKETPSGTES